MSQNLIETVGLALYEQWRNEIQPPADEPWEDALPECQQTWKLRGKAAFLAVLDTICEPMPTWNKQTGDLWRGCIADLRAEIERAA
jgi:hypothetical protein